ncbi:uncharacterized protein LOC134780204 [Penaeus indicus]|uniref:uncharacterized protein LOC134780204 n=1 Tax=Penaeus indicus TaxID=29960 RepID=UPI00300D8760
MEKPTPALSPCPCPTPPRLHTPTPPCLSAPPSPYPCPSAPIPLPLRSLTPAQPTPPCPHTLTPIPLRSYAPTLCQGMGKLQKREGNINPRMIISQAISHSIKTRVPKQLRRVTSNCPPLMVPKFSIFPAFELVLVPHTLTIDATVYLDPTWTATSCPDTTPTTYPEATSPAHSHYHHIPRRHQPCPHPAPPQMPNNPPSPPTPPLPPTQKVSHNRQRVSDGGVFTAS